jgi:hypothetical protein
MFHAKDGLFFERREGGDVRVMVTLNGEHPKEGLGQQKNIYFETVLPRGVFASLLAYMSDRGYSTEAYYEAYEYLQARPYDEPKVN